MVHWNPTFIQKGVYHQELFKASMTKEKLERKKLPFQNKVPFIISCRNYEISTLKYILLHSFKPVIKENRQIFKHISSKHTRSV